MFISPKACWWLGVACVVSAIAFFFNLHSDKMPWDTANTGQLIVIVLGAFLLMHSDTALALHQTFSDILLLRKSGGAHGQGTGTAARVGTLALAQDLSELDTKEKVYLAIADDSDKPLLTSAFETIKTWIIGRLAPGTGGNTP